MMNMKNVQHHVNFSKIIIFRRTPRNNSSQNSLSGSLVRLNQNWESDSKSIVVNAFHKHLWVLCFGGLKSSKVQLFLEQKINFFGQKLACLAQVKVQTAYVDSAQRCSLKQLDIEIVQQYYCDRIEHNYIS